MARAGAVVAPNLYLDESIGRPDLYEREVTLGSDITKGHHTQKLLRNIVVIVISAFIFITIVGWANVLKVGYDSLWVNEAILPEFYSTLYYSITVTGISLLVCTLLVLYLSDR